MTRPTTRRDFLTGKRAEPLPGPPHGDESAQDSARLPSADQDETSFLLQVSRPAMACEFEVCFNDRQYPHAAEAAMEALDRVEALEDQLSYFRSASHISRLNLVAADGPVEIEPNLFDLLQSAMTLWRETEGAFDIASAPLWEVWGFARREGRLPAQQDVAEALERVGSRYVELDAGHRTVHFTRPGVRLNLGSIGKGYALDRAAEVLAGKGIGDFLFHGGQSSVLARGSRARVAGAEESAGWSVGLRHPLRPEQRLAEIRLRDRALGTSGSTKQFFWHRGKRYAHILDPRTGQPAEGVLSVTVLAPTAALADGLSTALFVMGPEAAHQFCRQRPELAALFVCPRPGSPQVDLHAIGFAPGELRVLDAV